jgi:hypothetical protein
MTEQEYIQLREQREIPMSAWFEFYREKGGTLDDIVKFEEVFTTLVVNQSVIGVVGSPNLKQITLKSALSKFYQHYNEKFGL